MLGNFLWYYYNNIFLFNSFPNSDWYFLTRISFIQKKKNLIIWTKMFHENITDSNSCWGNTDSNALVPTSFPGKLKRDPNSLAWKACINCWVCSRQLPKPGWCTARGEHNQGDLETETPSLRDAMCCRHESCAKQLVSAEVAWAEAGEQASDCGTQKPQMPTNRAVEKQCACSSAQGRLQVSIKHDLVFEWAVNDWAPGLLTATSTLHRPLSCGTVPLVGPRVGISTLHYIKAIIYYEMV